MGFGIYGLRFRLIKGLRIRIQGSGFRFCPILGVRFRIHGLRFRI